MSNPVERGALLLQEASRGGGRSGRRYVRDRLGRFASTGGGAASGAAYGAAGGALSGLIGGTIGGAGESSLKGGRAMLKGALRGARGASKAGAVMGAVGGAAVGGVIGFRNSGGRPAARARARLEKPVRNVNEYAQRRNAFNKLPPATRKGVSRESMQAFESARHGKWRMKNGPVGVAGYDRSGRFVVTQTARGVFVADLVRGAEFRLGKGGK